MSIQDGKLFARTVMTSARFFASGVDHCRVGVVAEEIQRGQFEEFTTLHPYLTSRKHRPSFGHALMLMSQLNCSQEDVEGHVPVLKEKR